MNKTTARSSAVMQATNNVIYSDAIGSDLSSDYRSMLMKIAHALAGKSMTLIRWEGMTAKEQKLAAKEGREPLNQVRYIVPLNTAMTPYSMRSEEGDGRRNTLMTDTHVGGVSLDRYLEAAVDHGRRVGKSFTKFSRKDFAAITADIDSRRGSIRKFSREGADIQIIKF